MAGELLTGGKYDVTYYEVPDLYAESWRPDGVQHARGCRVQWSERFEFVQSILGVADGIDPATGRIRRYLPHEHPAFPGMYAVDCNLSDRLGVPNQDGDGVITFDQRSAAGAAPALGSGDSSGWAVYTVTYSRPNFSVLADDEITSEKQRFVLKLYKFATEMLTLPGQAFKWDALASVGLPANNPGVAVPASQAGNPLAADITKPFPTQPITYQWLQVPFNSVLAAKFATAIGRVNASAWESHGAETLLLQSVEVTPKQHAGSAFLYQVDFGFIKRPTGWNKIYNRTAGNVLPVVNVTGGQPSIYATYDFDLLFTLA